MGPTRVLMDPCPFSLLGILTVSHIGGPNRMGPLILRTPSNRTPSFQELSHLLEVPFKDPLKGSSVGTVASQVSIFQ